MPFVGWILFGLQERNAELTNANAPVVTTKASAHGTWQEIFTILEGVRK